MIGMRRLREAVSDGLEYRAIRTHRSRLGRRSAPLYTAHWSRCRAAFDGTTPDDPEIARAAGEFDGKGFTSLWTPDSGKLAQSMYERIADEERRGLDIWDREHRYRDIYAAFPEIEQLFRGPVGAFLTALYRAHFKIFYGVLYKSERRHDRPTGSQLWHADGGPGTCTNVMVYLKDVEKEDGAMQCLPWEVSLKVFKGERAAVRRWLATEQAAGRTPSAQDVRDAKCDYFRQRIERHYTGAVEQPTGPAGLILPFRNNIVHRGGYPETGRTRYACVFHVYPSDKPTPYERYRRTGIGKSESYPRDPAAEF
jgi:hypothetical protein